MYDSYSVLMSVYYKEKAEYLRESMQSIYDQTVPTNDFVLVCDGPLNEELDSVIEEMQDKFGDNLHVHRLEKNCGLGNALNFGIDKCTNDLVARMDSDDISRVNRCELQLSIFNNKQEISIVSGTVEEFSKNVNIIEAKKVVPEINEDIISFAKSRNPYNHPCVMYKKDAVKHAGGYRDFYLLEDYYLWIRMIQDGAIGYNIQSPILWMRAGNEMYLRRGGKAYFKSQHRLFKYMKDVGFISCSHYIFQSFVRGIIAMSPNEIRILFYDNILRK